MAELRSLLDGLRRGEMPALGVTEVDALVGWLLGKGDDIAELPKPEHDPVLQQMVFYRLDATIFSGGELRLTAAGLGHDEPADLRKTRFRRLAGAFHPDRHPDLADWLTERSQAVLRAYGRFKHGDEPAPPPIRTAAPPYPGYPPPRRPRRGPFRRTRVRLRAATESLRRRFGNDRFLPHKLIGGLALLAMLPVLNLLLVPEPVRVDEAAVARQWVEGGRDVGNEMHRGDPVEAPSARSAGILSEADEAAPVASESASGAPTDGGSADGAASYSREEANGDSALLAAAREAMRLDASEYAYLPSVDQQLEAMGLDTDSERLYRRMRNNNSAGSAPAARSTASADSSRRAPIASSTPPAARESSAAGADSVGVVEAEVRSPAVEAPPLEPAPALAETTSSSGSSTADAMSGASAAGNFPAAESPRAPDPDAVADADSAAGSAVATPPLPELAASELTLGLLNSHPAGAVLRGFVGDVEAGNLIALLGRFDRQARHGPLRGTDPIARHYRMLFDRHSPRRTELKVLRVERDGSRWRIETELRIEGLQGDRIVAARSGRATFTLGGDPLRIQRLEF